MGSPTSSGNLSDETLMHRFTKKRSIEAFTEIYNRYFAPLSRYVTWLSNDAALGKDVAQNILVKVYKSPQQFDTSKKLKVWLFVIAKNEWKNELRKNSRKKDIIRKMTTAKSAMLDETEVEGKQQKLLGVGKAIEQLSENHKEVIILKYSSNLTIREISTVLECSEGTIKSRLFHAIQNLKTKIK